MFSDIPVCWGVSGSSTTYVRTCVSLSPSAQERRRRGFLPLVLEEAIADCNRIGGVAGVALDTRFAGCSGFTVTEGLFTEPFEAGTPIDEEGAE